MCNIYGALMPTSFCARIIFRLEGLHHPRSRVHGAQHGQVLPRLHGSGWRRKKRGEAVCRLLRGPSRQRL